LGTRASLAPTIRTFLFWAVENSVRNTPPLSAGTPTQPPGGRLPTLCYYVFCAVKLNFQAIYRLRQDIFPPKRTIFRCPQAARGCLQATRGCPRAARGCPQAARKNL
jgi:hypothetical protein